MSKFKNIYKYKKLFKNMHTKNIDQMIFKRLIPKHHATWKWNVYYIWNMCKLLFFQKHVT
jgi:hypothetical protein